MSSLSSQVESLESEIVILLCELIRIPSPTGEESRIGGFLAQKCRDLGLDVRIVEAEAGRPNVIATWDSGVPGPTLLLNDHLDTFPTGPKELWTRDPYAAEVVDGRVYGRGSIDTKSGVTTLVMAIKALKRAGCRLRGKLVLILSCDEETGASRLGIRHLARMGLVAADMALVAEPTSMQIEIATKGRLEVEIVTHGRAIHAARPWLGHNAIVDMMHVTDALMRLDEDLAKRQDPLLGRASLSIGTIKGGTISNLVPSECCLAVDRRVLPSESEEEAFKEFQDIIDRLNSTYPEFRATLSKKLWWPGYVLDKNEKIVELAKQAFTKVTGKAARVAGKDAGTDASWINVLTGIPVIMFSPGQGHMAGSVDEFVDINDVVTATKVVAQIVHDALSLSS